MYKIEMFSDSIGWHLTDFVNTIEEFETFVAHFGTNRVLRLYHVETDFPYNEVWINKIPYEQIEEINEND